MTSRTKCRLAVLALGLIAAAPQVIRAVAELQPKMDILGGQGGPSLEAIAGSPINSTFVVGIGPILVGYFTEPEQSSLWIYPPGGSQPDIVHLPRPSITLRVACAVALAGVWLLVLGGRLLARRWTRKNPSSVAV